MGIVTRFNRGDEVWIMYNDKPQKRKVIAMSIFVPDNPDHGPRIEYALDFRHEIKRTEDNVFKTLDELIESLKKAA